MRHALKCSLEEAVWFHRVKRCFQKALLFELIITFVFTDGGIELACLLGEEVEVGSRFVLDVGRLGFFLGFPVFSLPLLFFLDLLLAAARQGQH